MPGFDGATQTFRGKPAHHGAVPEEGKNQMTDIRKESDSLGEVDVAAGKLWRRADAAFA
jgi:hypothetical protein